MTRSPSARRIGTPSGIWIALQSRDRVTGSLEYIRTLLSCSGSVRPLDRDGLYQAKGPGRVGDRAASKPHQALPPTLGATRPPVPRTVVAAHSDSVPRVGAFLTPGRRHQHHGRSSPGASHRPGVSRLRGLARIDFLDRRRRLRLEQLLQCVHVADDSPELPAHRRQLRGSGLSAET